MKIRCVERLDETINWFTIGGVYEVKGDTLVDDQGYKWNNCPDIDFINNVRLSIFYRFELVTEEPTPSKPTKEQLANLKPGDKVRLRSDRGSRWASSGRMDKYCNRVVTIAYVSHDRKSFDITEEDLNGDPNWSFYLPEDIAEIITPEPTPAKEPVKPVKPWKESLIDQINQLPFEGGIIALSISERERARIIELINAM